MMRRIVIAAALLALAGCSSPVVMRNPSTGEVTDCGSHYAVGLYTFAAERRSEACVADYRAQGWMRAPK